MKQVSIQLGLVADTLIASCYEIVRESRRADGVRYGQGHTPFTTGVFDGDDIVSLFSRTIDITWGRGTAGY